MKCIFISLYDDPDDDEDPYSSVTTRVNFTMYKSKKYLLKCLIKNLRYDDGTKPNFKKLKDFLYEFRHSMWVINPKNLDAVVKKFRKYKNHLTFSNFKYKK
jgi:hypothetical protein